MHWRKERTVFLLTLMSMRVSNGSRAVLNYCAFSKPLKKKKGNIDAKSIAECGLHCKNIHMTEYSVSRKFKSITGNETELVEIFTSTVS